MHTSIGRVLECLNPTTHIVDDGYSAGFVSDKTATESIRWMLTDVPHYVADSKIIALAGTDPAIATLEAMAKAGIRALPFDPILIEFMSYSRSGARISNFVRLQTKPALPDSRARNRDDGTPIDVDVYAYLVQARPREGNPDEMLMASLPLETPIQVVFGDVDENNQKRAFVVWVHSSILDDPDDPACRMEYDMHLIVAEAMGIAMLMLNTKGIEHARVDTSRLNKARARKGSRGNKTPIAPYTVLRIGHVYDAYGKAHSVTGSGRHMPVHWRAGHVRNPLYGPAKDASGNRIAKEQRPSRPVFIPPCLVNFDPLVPVVPTPKREVTV